MKGRSRRKNWWRETREHIDVRQNVYGVIATLLYAAAIITLALVLSILLSIAFSPRAAGAQEAEVPELATSVDLIERASELDGRTVTYEGEAIGEALERGSFAWVNIGDKKNAIGVWLTRDQAKRIGRFGGYNDTGDFVSVIGTFNRACPQHGGDLDIHAESLKVLSQGAVIQHPVSGSKLLAASVLVVLALLAGWLNIRRRRAG